LSPLVNETVHVSARGESGPGYSYEWDYDDDGSYELQGRSASFHFDTSGDHRVTLRATGPGGRSVTRTLTLTVRETREQTGGPASDGRTTFLYAPLSPQDAELVTLVALPSFPVDDVASYGWDFDGDGTVDETGRIVERPGRLNATVQVTLQVTRTDGTVETVVKQVPVAKPRQVGGSPTPTNSASATSPTVSATDPGVTSDSFPGFGAVLAVTAIVLVVAGTRRRQSE
jgi:PGF-CTERM protein